MLKEKIACAFLLKKKSVFPRRKGLKPEYFKDIIPSVLQLTLAVMGSNGGVRTLENSDMFQRQDQAFLSA